MAQLTKDDARLLELTYDSSDDEDQLEVSEDVRCKYPSKYCGHPRAAKASGKLHRFCEYHRQRANSNQKRWTAIRRQHARAAHHASTAHLTYVMPMPPYYGFMAPVVYSDLVSTPSPLVPLVPPEDLEETSLLDDEDLEELVELLTPMETIPWTKTTMSGASETASRTI